MIGLDLKEKALQALKDVQEIATTAIEAGKNMAVVSISSAEEVEDKLKEFGLKSLQDVLGSLDAISRMTAQMLRRSIKDGVIGLMETAEEINSILKSKGPVSPK